MEDIKHLRITLCAVACVLLFCAVANAQVVITRKPNESVTERSQPEPPIREKPSPELINTADAQGIREVKVIPGEKGAAITFRARSGVVPLVEISNQQPVRREGGRLEFPNRLSLTNAAPVPNKYEISPTGYTASISDLEAGTRYYFIITTGDGPSTRQYRGSFTTIEWRLSVKVFFTEIKVTNDSDDGGDGELFFNFYVNRGQVSFWGTPTISLSWNDDEPPRAIPPPVEFEISDSPETLELQVDGYDEDGPLGVKTGIDPGPLGAPFDNTWFEANLAKQTFNLNDFPGERVRHDFTQESMRQAAGQGDLSFNVKGYFEITRTKRR
jgi:hypothetical protein